MLPRCQARANRIFDLTRTRAHLRVEGDKWVVS
jgi:hypothetical protein